jgi:hypothetical protein
MAGLPEVPSPDEERELENVPVIPFNPVLAVGEGQRTLSWIWYDISTSERERGEIDGCE